MQWVCECIRTLVKDSAFDRAFAMQGGKWLALILCFLLLSGCRDGDSRSALERAARAGDAEAQEQLAYQYLYGVEVDEDQAQARHWFELSAAQGLSYSQRHLAQLYLEDGDARLRTKARALLEAAVADGYTAAGPDLASLIATSPDSNAEDGARAVGLLETSLREGASIDIEQFEVLAAAYARAGRYAEAVGAERHAIAGVDCRCEAEVLRARERRLAAYLRGDTWNEVL